MLTNIGDCTIFGSHFGNYDQGRSIIAKRTNKLALTTWQLTYLSTDKKQPSLNSFLHRWLFFSTIKFVLTINEKF